jgi:hypothetical protein
MQPLSSAIPSILQQAGLTATVKPEECQLLLKNKPLDATLAYRFANLPTGAKITLKTGHERVLGFHDSSAPAPTSAPPSTAAVKQQQNVASTSKVVPEKPVANPSPAAAAADPPAQQQQQQPQPSSPAAPVEKTKDSGNIFAGKSIHVFSRETEVQEDTARASSAATDLDESAYEVTEADVRRQLASYAKKDQEAKHLMTKQMREAEQARKAASYGSVPVRVEFPEGTVLQASFPAVAPVAELHELIKTALLPEAAKTFYLFTTPPKVELKDMSLSFYAANLVPAARVHVGFKGGAAGDWVLVGSCLRPEVAALMGRPPSRAEALGIDEKKNAVGGAEDAAGPSGSRAAAGAAAAGTAQGEPTKRAKPGGVPSWMKLSNR